MQILPVTLCERVEIAAGVFLVPRTLFFFFTEPAPTEIYTLSLHDALPICAHRGPRAHQSSRDDPHRSGQARNGADRLRSEEHTSELQSLTNLVCRLLLEKKKHIRCVTESSTTDPIPEGELHGRPCLYLAFS